MSRIDDGHPTLISFANYPSVSFWEKEVTPPGMQGGGENDTTTMHNSTWRTRNPKTLKTMSNCSFTAAYDPVVYNNVVAMINENQGITITFPDSSTLTFWGWLDEFTPNRVVAALKHTCKQLAHQLPALPLLPPWGVPPPAHPLLLLHCQSPPGHPSLGEATPQAPAYMRRLCDVSIKYQKQDHF